ncbi:DUF6119 family protein [Candidatus Mycoplasma mahonii]|uniref:DUF6119 family protein n=1 Tax=Candidatus Mycoplasma mahonii TaxID=3004105 RepID=UPI0026EC9F88|nr:DUF6119 family protein [Candidatus Mycoplasma mahonii]WKX02757.1 TIGR04141 family sporadically distributed protein [Candidatus Mycoplasma mahonii]
MAIKRDIKINLYKNDFKISDILIDHEKYILTKSEEIDKSHKDNEYIFISGDVYQTYIRKSQIFPIHEPLIDSFSGAKIKKYVSKLKAIIFKKIDNRYFSISIGNTSELINYEYFEDNFGIKSIINHSKSLNKEIKINLLSSKNKVSGDNLMQGKNKYTDFNNYRFKKIYDNLKSMKIKYTLFEKTGSVMYLNDGIRIAINNDYNPSEITNCIEDFIKEYFLNDSKKSLYKKDFDFLDFYQNVDNDMENKLWNIVKKQLKGNEYKGLIAWPTFEDTNHAYFHLDKLKEQFYDLSNKLIKEANIVKGRTQIENMIVHSMDDGSSGDSSLSHKKLKYLLSTEQELNGEFYILNEGKWLLVNKDYKDEVNEKYKSIATSKIKFPNWPSKEHESEYNTRVASEKLWINIDKKMVQFGNLEKLEIADLLIKNKTLIAVKALHNSASISHLVAQVRNSISAIKRNSEKINNYLNNHLNNKSGMEIDVSDISEFVLAIGTSKILDDGKPYLPFFARSIVVDEIIDRNSDKIELKIVAIKQK